MEIFLDFLPLIKTFMVTLLCSALIYFFIRFLAYKRSFPLPHQFDFLWILATLLVLFLFCSDLPPFQKTLSEQTVSLASFLTFLLLCYVGIFLMDQFIVEYFLVTVVKLYVAPPLRRTIVLFIFGISVLIGMQQIFSMNPLTVYAPAGAITLGAGIALKDAFATFFAGLAISRIVHIGDWISLGDREGQVKDIDWARTVLRTWEGSTLFIPNSELQSSIFYSYSYKDLHQRCRLEVRAAYESPPQKVKGVLRSCVQNVDGVLNAPPPDVLLLKYGDFSIDYALTFWISDYSRYREITSDVATRIWYAFKREGIKIPFPIRMVHTAHEQPESQFIEPENVLVGIDLFHTLSSHDRHILVERLLKQVYLKGELVVREGESGSSFYIVSKGRLEVLKNNTNGTMDSIGELSPGGFFGELSLLTGEPRTATIRALGDAELLRLEKSDFKEILDKHPQLSEKLADAVNSHQVVLAEHSAKQEVAVPESNEPSSLSRKIREFFNLKV